MFAGTSHRMVKCYRSPRCWREEKRKTKVVVKIRKYQIVSELASPLLRPASEIRRLSAPDSARPSLSRLNATTVTPKPGQFTSYPTISETHASHLTTNSWYSQLRKMSLLKNVLASHGCDSAAVTVLSWAASIAPMWAKPCPKLQQA